MKTIILASLLLTGCASFNWGAFFQAMGDKPFSGGGESRSSSTCTACYGSGVRATACQYCDGKGRWTYGECGYCEGTGRKGEKCRSCDGSGKSR
jgi:DnaJ-class molecular chaperone